MHMILRGIPYRCIRILVYIICFFCFSSPAFAQSVGVVEIVKTNGSDGAIVFVDGEDYGQLPMKLQLPAGKHDIVVKKYLCADYTTSIIVKRDEQITVAPTMIQNAVERKLFVYADANIFLDGTLLGVREWTGAIPLGKHTIECKLPNYKNSSCEIDVSLDSQGVIELKKPIPICGSLVISSSVPGATVSIDGIVVGSTPFEDTETIIGPKSVVVSKIGYKTETKDIIIYEGQVSELSFVLTAVANIVVDSKPKGATLAINGAPVGKTPYSTTLESGEYSIDLAAKNFKTLHSKLKVDGTDRTINYRLERQYMQPNSFYLSGGFQYGGMTGVAAQVGFFAGGFNLEGCYIMALGESDVIYWNSPSTMSRPSSYAYKPTYYAAKAGYGFVIGSRLRITPQAGAGLVQLNGRLVEVGAEDPGATEGYCIPVVVDARVDFAIAPCIALTVTPSVSFSAVQSEVYLLLT